MVQQMLWHIATCKLQAAVLSAPSATALKFDKTKQVKNYSRSSVTFLPSSSFLTSVTNVTILCPVLLMRN